VVGVVGSIRHQDLSGGEVNRAGAAYVLYSDPRHTPRTYTLAVRSEASAESVARDVRAIARDLDPDVPLYEVGAMTDRIEGSVASRRFALTLVTLFASVAVGLAATGVHGVLVVAAAQRRREFGIRMALGSSGRRIVSLVVGETATLVAIGLGVGLIAAVLVRGALAETVFEFGAGEGVVWILSAGLLVATSLAALVGPAIRVARIDPVDVLAEE
jgi:putative ABC transport system permease protein